MNVKITEIACCDCGISFWLTDGHNDELQRSHKSFYCPNGHSQSYPGETCEKKLERVRGEIANKEYYLGREKRSNAALRGVITKLKKKAGDL